jgi:hypothetical protein
MSRASISFILAAALGASARAAVIPMQLDLQAADLQWDQITMPAASNAMTVSVDKTGGPTENITGWQLFLTIVPRAGESTGFIDFNTVQQSAATYIFAANSGGVVVQTDPQLPYVFFAYDDSTNVPGVNITAGGAGKNLLDLTFTSPVTARGKFDIVATPSLGRTQWSAPPTAQVPPDPPDSGDRAFNNFPFGPTKVLATVTVVPEPAGALGLASAIAFSRRRFRSKPRAAPSN